MNSIVAKDLMAHATFLASDELGGRLTGSKGQLAAAKYIADHFAKLGLEPLGDELPEGEGKAGRGFYQHYGVIRTYVDEGSRLELGKLQLDSGFSILGGQAMDVKAQGKLRFVGLGRTKGTSAEVGEEEDLAGAVAVAVIRPPRGKIDRVLSVEEKFSMSFRSFGQLGATAKNLEKSGASAVVFLLLEDPMGLADPSNRHAMFSSLVRDAALFGEQLGMQFESGDKYYMRSDHYNFAKKGIPVVFFCNGEHEDYHQVTDHADKLDGAKMERIARLAFWTGWNAANADERPAKLGRQEDWR